VNLDVRRLSGDTNNKQEHTDEHSQPQSANSNSRSDPRYGWVGVGLCGAAYAASETRSRSAHPVCHQRPFDHRHGHAAAQAPAQCRPQVRRGDVARGVADLAMALSEAANAWWGTTQMLPIAASQAGATGGAAWHELVVKLTHIGAGLGLVAAWALLVAGFLKKPAASGTPDV
jgi:hypothetical protein